MKYLVHFLADQPVSILLTKINRNLSQKILIQKKFESFLFKKKFQLTQQKLIPANKLQSFVEKLVFAKFKKRHLNASKNWIFEKYSLFIFTYKIIPTQRKPLKYSFANEIFFLNKSDKENYSKFLYSTLKLPNYFYTKNLNNSKKTHKNLSQNYIQKKIKKAPLKIDFSKKHSSKSKINLVQVGFNIHSFKVQSEQILKFKKLLNTTLGYTYVSLANQNFYTLKQNLKYSLSVQRKVNQKSNKRILDQSQISKVLTNDSNFVHKSSQILTNFLGSSMNENLSLKTQSFSKLKLPNLPLCSLIVPQKTVHQLKFSNQIFSYNYPLFSNINSKIDLIENFNNQQDISL